MNGARYAWGAVLVLLLGVGTWATWKASGREVERPGSDSAVEGKGRRDDGGQAASSSDTQSASSSDTNNEPSSAARADALPPRVTEAPRAVATNTLRVIDGQGLPIEGAWATWTPLAALQDEFALGRDHGALLASSLQAFSDSEGRLSLELQDGSGDGPWVLWVTHPDHLPAARRVGAGRLGVALEAIVLEAGAGVRVQVVDEDGEPRAGAELFTFLPDSAVPGADPALEEDLRRGFARGARTDEQGWATLPGGTGHQHVTARAGELRAPPWYGSAPAQVRLVLAGTVSLSGRVRLPAGVPLPDDLRVTALAYTEALLRTLGRTRVASDGAFGGLEVAHQVGFELQVRVDGHGLVATEKRIPFPPPGGHANFVLEPPAAVELAARIRDVQDRPVHPAHVEAWWQAEGGWMSGQWSADAAGDALVFAPPAAVWVFAQAPGFQASGMLALDLSTPPDDALTLRLERAGSVEGRVMFAGEPVSNFVVHYWGTNQAGANRQGFSDSLDGRFALPDAPLGQVSLVAQAEGLAPSAPILVEVVAGRTSEIEFELHPARSARGRVVDAFSGEGIANARVSTWIKDGSVWVQGTGHSALSDGQGVFALEPLAAGANHLEISASGYTTLNGLLELDGEGDGGEAGTFALTPAQDLLVRLVSPTPLDFGALRASLVGIDPPQEQSFSAAGEALFTGIPARSQTVRVQLPDGVLLEERATLVAGRPWRIEMQVDADAGGGLEVDVRAPEPLGSEWAIRAITSVGRDHWRERHAALLGGRARIPGPFGEDVVVRLVDGEGRARMTRQLSRAQALGQRLVLEFDDERREFELSDQRGEPIAGAMLILHLHGEGSNWSEGTRTDGRGRAVLCLPFARDVLLHVRLPGGGGVADLRVELPPKRTELVRVQVETDARLRVRFEDHGVAAQGLAPPLTAASGYRFQFLSNSDSQGYSDSGPIRAGSYRLTFETSGYWPIDLPIEVRPGTNELTLPIRRLGGLDLVVRSPEGSVVIGARVALRNLEFGEQVESWIEQGRVQAPRPELVTGPDGTLYLSGLPNGAYRFRVQAPDGRVAMGELSVPPHARAQVFVTLP